MKKFRILSLAMAAALCFALAAGCSGGNSGSGTATTPDPAAPETTTGGSDAAPETSAGGSDTAPTGAAFKLGGTGPLTGAASIYGLAAWHGAEIAVEEINAEGGAIQFELRYEDDVHDAEKAVNAYDTL